MVLAAYGILVIGLVDNVLRPILVGKDTKMPDYVVLISTLGGMSVFGISGFVLGPALAALFMAAWELFTLMQQQESERLHQDTTAPSEASPQLKPQLSAEEPLASPNLGD